MGLVCRTAQAGIASKKLELKRLTLRLGLLISGSDELPLIELELKVSRLKRLFCVPFCVKIHFLSQFHKTLLELYGINAIGFLES